MNVTRFRARATLYRDTFTVRKSITIGLHLANGIVIWHVVAKQVSYTQTNFCAQLIYVLALLVIIFTATEFWFS